MEIVEFQRELENKLILLIKQRNDLKDNLNKIQPRLRSIRKHPESEKEREQLAKQEDELVYQIESTDCDLQEVRNQISIIKSDIGSFNTCINLPIFVKGRNNIGYFLDKFTDSMESHKVPKDKWGKELLKCFENEDYYYVRRILPANEDGWPKFIERLNLHFGGKSELEKGNDLINFKSKEGESLDISSERFSHLVYQSGPSVDSILVASFLRSIDPDQRELILKSSLFKLCFPSTPKLKDVLELARSIATTREAN
jgi:hypothetical protein